MKLLNKKKGHLSQKRPRTQTRLRYLMTSLSWSSPASTPDTAPLTGGKHGDWENEDLPAAAQGQI